MRIKQFAIDPSTWIQESEKLSSLSVPTEPRNAPKPHALWVDASPSSRPHI